MSKSTIVEKKFRCTNPSCKAEDTVRMFSGERMPEVINCWKCHGGYGMQKAQMLQTGAGMMPVPQSNA